MERSHRRAQVRKTWYDEQGIRGPEMDDITLPSPEEVVEMYHALGWTAVPFERCAARVTDDYEIELEKKGCAIGAFLQYHNLPLYAPLPYNLRTFEYGFDQGIGDSRVDLYEDPQNDEQKNYNAGVAVGIAVKEAGLRAV